MQIQQSSAFQRRVYSIMLCTEETILISSPGLKTKRHSCTISLEAGQRRSSREAVYFTGESDVVQEAVESTPETNLMSSSVLETKRRSTSREAGQRCRSREAVYFTGDSALSIMLAQEVAKYTQETTRRSSPGLETKRCSFSSTSREAGQRSTVAAPVKQCNL